MAVTTSDLSNLPRCHIDKFLEREDIEDNDPKTVTRMQKRMIISRDMQRLAGYFFSRKEGQQLATYDPKRRKELKSTNFGKLRNTQVLLRCQQETYSLFRKIIVQKTNEK